MPCCTNITTRLDGFALSKLKPSSSGESPGGLAVSIRCFHCWGPGWGTGQKQQLPISSPQPLEISIPPSASTNLPWGPHVGGITQKLSGYFTQHHSLKVHPYYSRCQTFLPFYDPTVSRCIQTRHMCSPIHLLMDPYIASTFWLS